MSVVVVVVEISLARRQLEHGTESNNETCK